MAILLYKKGDTHTVKGVKCELGRFPVDKLKDCLAAGWKVTPEETLESKPGRVPKSEIQAEERIGADLLRRARLGRREG